MSLKFKRNLPLMLLLVGIISILIVTVGNYPIVAYSL